MGETVKNLEHAYIANENVNDTATLQQSETELSCSGSYTPKYVPNRMKHLCLYINF